MRLRRLPTKHLPTLRKRKARETSELTHAMVDHVMLFTTCSAPVLSCYGGYSTVAMEVTQQLLWRLLNSCYGGYSTVNVTVAKEMNTLLFCGQ